MEVHDEPSRARSDAGNALRLDLLERLIRKLVRIDAAARERVATPASTGPPIGAPS
jgi:3-deoxy-D-manno-octulosonic acid (KDO) 8-phosphate synthase